MVSLEFSQGKANPRVFYRSGRDLRVVVHGDDFTVGGFGEELDCFRKRIAEEFEVKFRARLGEEEEDEKSVRILNRVIEWRNNFGLVYEADQRHTEIIIRDLGLDGASKAVLTPGVKEVSSEEIVFDTTRYRGLVARASYLEQDRPDIQFAVKELRRKMAAPVSADWMRLKGLAEIS